MRAVLGRRFDHGRGRIERRRHAPGSRIGLGEADELGAFVGRARDGARRVGDIGHVGARPMANRLHHGDAKGHGGCSRSALGDLSQSLTHIEAAPPGGQASRGDRHL